VKGDRFVKPEERRMKFVQFLDDLETHHRSNSIKSSEQQGVYYIQHQNGNFKTEFDELADDIDPEISWVSEAFGIQPDVVNFWMGDERAVSSLHKDHYENLYVVVSGEKHFTLLPPIDFPFLYETPFISATYQQNRTGEFVVKDDQPPTFVPWIPVDPDNADLDRFPLFQHARPIHCTVRAGEILYLPSMYYHRVSQSVDIEGQLHAIIGTT